ncbi:glycoside hydrolase family 78 protein [Streptomyces sp. NBC_01808]|uniref:family 78 glycoside hydrolase catalytic domain n=1 Tax=Streptomyces sp. NBC_01808 TaxID=2975947 RepID=UPI002DD8E4B4|nr:family 78 glycoside hydrolase catalytic domain [Streptomyces sp. NBC_01808]WSA40198.1 glycoside hydrolase family 78 protein [Streptomyces sp. NBC_01808]
MATPWSRRTFLATGGAAVALGAASGAAAPVAARDARDGDRAAPLAPAGLTVGDRARPLNVEGTPQFGWLPRDTRPGEIQTAYQVRVFATGTHGGRPTPTQPVWDSGRVDSGRQSYVPYAGAELARGATYGWTVRTWDRAGQASPWAPPASFDTGIADGDWQAEWIRRTTEEPDDYTLARKEFAVGASPVVRARLYVASQHQYEARVNGEPVDRGQAFNHPDQGYYQATDVTPALRAGAPAAVGVLVHWYGRGQGRPAAAPGLLVRLVVDHADGSRQVVVTDASWQVARAPWLTAPRRNGDGGDYVEHVDGGLARQLHGWDEPGFEADSAWAAPQVVGAHPAGPFTGLRGQEPRLAFEDVRPASVTTLDSGAVVVDFGKVIPARPVIRFRAGTAGRDVSMHAGYVHASDGSVSDSADDNQDTDLSYGYVQHDGPQTFEAFTYEAFRYLQIDNPGEPLDARSVSALVQHTDVDPGRAATLHSSDETLDAVFTLLRRSAVYSAQEQFLDTPTREKGQFLADSVDISRALMGGYGERVLTRKAIREFAESQRRHWPDGRLNAVYPNGDGKRDIPDFTEMYPGWVWEYYLRSGDHTTLRDAYPVMSAVADYVRRYVDPDTGLVTNLAGGSGAYLGGIIDWPVRYGYDTETAARTTVSILAVDVLRRTADTAAELGRPQAEARALRADADRLRDAVNARLRRPDGIYVDGLTAEGTQSTHASQIAGAYAIAFGVAPESDWPALADHLVALGLQMGPMTANWLLTALHRAGRDGEVLHRLTDAGTRGWANLLARGGTFTWESWEAPERGDSLSHGWGSTALVDVQQALLGVTVTAPGAAAVRIHPPRDTALTHAAGTVPTQRGPVGVRWRTADGGTTLSVDVPVNVTAEVRVPVTGDRPPRASGAGPDGERSPRFEGVRDGYARYVAGSGRSTFGPGNAA